MWHAAVRSFAVYVCMFIIHQLSVLVLTPWYEGVKVHCCLWPCWNPSGVHHVLNIMKGASIHIFKKTISRKKEGGRYLICRFIEI